jgi:hypothetical protein
MCGPIPQKSHQIFDGLLGCQSHLEGSALRSESGVPSVGGRVFRPVGLAGDEFVIGVHCAKVVAFPRIDRVVVLATDRSVEAVKHVISAPPDQSVVPHRAASVYG